jgi:hypothetical protein
MTKNGDCEIQSNRDIFFIGIDVDVDVDVDVEFGIHEFNHSVIREVMRDRKERKDRKAKRCNK